MSTFKIGAVQHSAAPTPKVNYRVADLHALIHELRAEGCNVLDKTEESEYGKFGWVIDPEGNGLARRCSRAPSAAAELGRQAATRQGASPMRAQVSLLIALACVACRPAARPAHTPRDSAGSSALDLPSAVEGVCDTVATLWRATGQAQVRLADTTMPVVSDSMTQSGCAVVATAPMGIDSTRWASLYWTTSQRRGWAELIAYAADGPDGSSRTLERQGVRCQIAVTQDGGDDSDSTYVPSPAIGETTFCWRTSS